MIYSLQIEKRCVPKKCTLSQVVLTILCFFQVDQATRMQNCVTQQGRSKPEFGTQAKV